MNYSKKYSLLLILLAFSPIAHGQENKKSWKNKVTKAAAFVGGAAAITALTIGLIALKKHLIQSHLRGLMNESREQFRLAHETVLTHGEKITPETIETLARRLEPSSDYPLAEAAHRLLDKITTIGNARDTSAHTFTIYSPSYLPPTLYQEIARYEDNLRTVRAAIRRHPNYDQQEDLLRNRIRRDEAQEKLNEAHKK